MKLRLNQPIDDIWFEAFQIRARQAQTEDPTVRYLAEGEEISIRCPEAVFENIVQKCRAMIVNVNAVADTVAKRRDDEARQRTEDREKAEALLAERAEKVAFH
jgi:hypothetical protein